MSGNGFRRPEVGSRKTEETADMRFGHMNGK